LLRWLRAADGERARTKTRERINIITLRTAKTRFAREVACWTFEDGCASWLATSLLRGGTRNRTVSVSGTRASFDVASDAPRPLQKRRQQSPVETTLGGGFDTSCFVDEKLGQGSACQGLHSSGSCRALPSNGRDDLTGTPQRATSDGMTNLERGQRPSRSGLWQSTEHAQAQPVPNYAGVCRTIRDGSEIRQTEKARDVKQACLFQ